MTTVLLSFLVLLLVVSAMAVGVLMGRKPIAGSCGGMNALGMETACEVCGGDQKKCEKESKRAAAQADPDLAYDATLSREQS